MAVVFISPKKRQKAFFIWITASFASLLILLCLAVFLAQPKEVSPELVFNKPKVNIDFDLLDSEQFKQLEPFVVLQNQFAYSAKTAKGKIVQGVLSANSIDDARKILEGMNLTEINVKESVAGRENPFQPYY